MIALLSFRLLRQAPFPPEPKSISGRRPLAKATRAIALPAAALAISVAVAQAFDFSRPLDRGGPVGAYVRGMASSAPGRHVISGDCMSACTMWLGRKGTCVTPDAVLWFHAASDPLQRMRDENPWRTISASGNATLLRMYPPRVREVVRPWLQSPDYHTLTGLQLAALGVPLCGRASQTDDVFRGFKSKRRHWAANLVWSRPY